MFRNYLLIACRNLVKHKVLSFINIGGLAISLASCIFIFYYIYDELSYDRFHEKANRIYRITQTFITPDVKQNIRWTHQKIGPYLHRVYPQVENYVRFEDAPVKLGKEQTKEKGIVRADPSVFDVFTYPLLKGNEKTALQKPNSIILSEALAKKYFRDGALGETIEVDGRPFEVTGIMKDVPPNSDKWISAMLYGDFEGEESPDLFYIYDTYILLKSPDDAFFINQQFEKIAKGLNQQSGQDVEMGFDMQALLDLHFFHGTEMDNPKGNKTNVYIFGVVALVLLLVAIINFINLTTVRSFERAKEVGIRKVAGAQNSHLIWQFLSESLLSVVFSSLIALFFINLLKIIFESVSGKNLSLTNTSDALIIAVILLLLILVTVLSSIYPAWILSSNKPVKVLKGKQHSSSGSGSIRKIFTAGQFALSTSLLVFLVVILIQMKFMHSRDLGFTKEKILVIRVPEDSLVNANLNYLTGELLKSKPVEQVSVGGFASNLGTTDPFASPIRITEGGQKRELIVPNIIVDKQYPEMLKLKLKEGKMFRDIEGDNIKGMALVNESFVKLVGWKKPLGQKVETYSGEGTVIGVLSDFHFQSLHNTIAPLVIMGMNPDLLDVQYLFLKITPPHNIDEIKVLWRKVFSGYEMEYLFLDDFFNEQYKTEDNLQLVFQYFALLTIIVSVSGLFGLTIHHIELRTKEIGIRKVFGAGVFSLIQLLSADFMKLILTGTTAGIIIGVFVSNYWLKNFAYRIDMNFQIVALPAFSVLFLSIAVLVYKTYRGSLRNPIDILRHE